MMVVGLGCEKLQPERLLPPGTVPAMTQVRLQDEKQRMALLKDAIDTLEATK